MTPVLLAVRLVSGDLNLDYPFMDGDSWDWIGNGLFLAGSDVRYSGRAPLLPLAIAFLERLSALPWLPVLLQILFSGTVLAFYDLAAQFAPRRAAFAAALALLTGYSLGSLSLQVMADVPASCLLFLAARSFVPGGRRYLASGVLAGLSVLTQPAALLWGPAAGLAVMARRRGDLRSPWLWAGFASFLALPALWSLAKPLITRGAAGDIADRQWDLLTFHTGSVPFYVWSLLSLLGWPGCLLLVGGLALAARRAVRDGSSLFLLALFSALIVFFVFLYDFNAKRFLVYPLWLGGLFIAEALGRLRSRAAFGAAAALLVTGAALPLPLPGNLPNCVGLSPFPPVYACAPLTVSASGNPGIDASAANVRTDPLLSWITASHPAQIWRAGAQGQVPRLDPATFAADRGALFLYENPEEGGGRYRTLTRLGNALRKRVKFVPRSLLDPYLPLLRISVLGSIAPDYTVYRVRLLGLADTWLLVTPEGSPLPERLGRPADSPALARGREKAAAIRSWIGEHDGFVALIPGSRADDLSQLYLPFLLETTELYVATPGEEQAMLDVLDPAPELAARQFGETRVKKTRYWGRPTSVVSY